MIQKDPLDEVCLMLQESASQRRRLREAGWERILNPPLVSNEWIWKHPQWMVQLQSIAIKILDSI